MPSSSLAHSARLLIGTAGWSLPRAEQAHFPSLGSHLERYSARFEGGEINSSFRRSHRSAVWEKWRDSVPAEFRFSVKMPKSITHQARLADADALIESFLIEVAHLREKLGCLLVQLPPSLAYNASLARAFFSKLGEQVVVPVACEPRHASWFEAEANALLADLHIARVAADPARVPAAAEPGGWREFVYFRLHGSPKIYDSAYGAEFLAALSARLAIECEQARTAWCVFDNTTLGAATGNALALSAALRQDA